MNKFTKFFKKILYALPFGMKGGNEDIFGAPTNSIGGQTINQNVADERVGKHLLKGEVTQSVKELRYRTYKVDDESKSFKYLGNGVAINEGKKERNLNHIKFSQECKLVTSSVLDDLKHVNDYGTEKYTLDIAYNNPNVKFKLEQFATQIDVELKNGIDGGDSSQFTNYVVTKLHFSSIPNGYEKKSAPFINELKNLKKMVDSAKSDEFIKAIFVHSEIASSMFTLNFITYKATNDEPDLISYSFANPMLETIEEENAEFILTFKWDYCLAKDLKANFYDATMEKKYEENTPKNVDFDLAAAKERVAHCEICGKEMNTYDADITRSTFGKAMCAECLEKYLYYHE